VAQLRQHLDDLDGLNTQVLIISFSTLPAAQSWLEETGAPFRLLLDPGRVVYRAYGLERSWRRAWNLRTIRRYAQLLRSGRRWRGIQGDSAQLGGDFILDAAGVLRMAYRSDDPTDRPPIEHILTVLHRLPKRD
jgi:hypothetical protein